MWRATSEALSWRKKSVTRSPWRRMGRERGAPPPPPPMATVSGQVRHMHLVPPGLQQRDHFVPAPGAVPAAVQKNDIHEDAFGSWGEMPSASCAASRASDGLAPHSDRSVKPPRPRHSLNPDHRLAAGGPPSPPSPATRKDQEATSC